MARRKLNIQSLVLQKGAHDNPEQGMCIMEAVAFVAGEPHTDSPICASPTIASFLRSWNDSLPDDKRQQLKPYIKRLVGSRGSEEIELARCWMASDWLNCEVAPAFLELAGKVEEAAALRALPPIRDAASAKARQRCRSTSVAQAAQR